LRSITVVPRYSHSESLVVHRHRDHFNGVTYLENQEQHKHYRYSGDLLKTLRAKASSLKRNTRKILFKLKVWKPNQQVEGTSSVTSDPSDSDEHSEAILARNTCTVIPIPEVIETTESPPEGNDLVTYAPDNIGKHSATIPARSKCNVPPASELTSGLPLQIPVRVSPRNDQADALEQKNGRNIQNIRQIDCTRWNIPVLLQTNPTSIKEKVAEVSTLMFKHLVDFCCVTESWCPDTVPDEKISIDTYTPIRRNRQSKKGGGIIGYVHASVPHEEIKQLRCETLETLWIRLNPLRMPRQFNPLVIGCVYHPPKSDDQAMIDHILESLDYVKGKYPKAGIIILGDFNHLPDRMIKSSYKLKQIVKKPTHTKSTIDLVYTNMSQYYEEPDHLSPIGLSKHHTILVQPKPSYKLPSSRKYKVEPRTTSQNQRTFFASALRSVSWESLYKLNSCQEQFVQFYDTIEGLLQEYFPTREVTRCDKDKPWVTDDFRVTMNRRELAWNSKNEPLWKHYRNKVNRDRKQLQNRYYKRNVEETKSSNPTKWWKGVKCLSGEPFTNSNPLITMVNQLHGGDMNALVNDINSFFQSVTAKLDPLVHIDYGNIDVPGEYIITVEQTERALLAIKCQKSPGPDGFPNWVLRNFAAVLGGPVCAIWNSSIRSGYIPDLWKSANVSPIPKVTPPKHIESDLRPVSLTAILMKELETFVFKWLWDILGVHIKSDQYGNIKGCSTTMALIEMFDSWAKASDTASTQIRILLLDYRKAFDLIDHNILMAKLMSYNVPPVLLRWIHAFLSNRKQRIKVGQVASEWVTLNGGVPQGTKLASLLFITQINDLEVEVPIIKYVDDSTASEILKQPTKAEKKKGVLPPISRMQSVADDVSKWTKENNMEVNPTKTKELSMCFSKNPVFPPLVTIDGVEIERVRQAKLLGIQASSDLKWQKQIDTVYSKASKKLYTVIMLSRAGLKQEDLVLVYCTRIRPILEYACQLWHPGLTKEQSGCLESIQKRVLKIIYRDLNYQEALAIAGIPTLKQRRNDMCNKLFTQMQNKDHRLHKLLPNKKENCHSLRKINKYETIKCKTNRYKHSFVPYCLDHFQE
jgi:hypothetical protein